MIKPAQPSTPSGSSATQQRRRQITSYKNTTSSPATDTRLAVPATMQKKAPATREGLFAYFSLAWNSSIWIFCDEDLIRSSNRRNSAVSSAIDFGGGLGGKGITSDMGRTSLGFNPARCLLVIGNCRVSAAQIFGARRECAIINSSFTQTGSDPWTVRAWRDGVPGIGDRRGAAICRRGFHPAPATAPRWQ